MTRPPVAKRVAVIGAGPAGGIAVDALAQEKCFEVIRVFERREGPGGCWIGDSAPPPPVTEFELLASRTADPPVPIPETLPATAPKLTTPRYDESSVYPYLHTNVDALPMEFTQEPFPTEVSDASVRAHGFDTPFRHWKVVREYVESLFNRNGYAELVEYNTSVERAEKVGAEWRLTLRRSGAHEDEWWTEWFDAVVVASGHYWVPYIPAIPGVEEFERGRPGSVIHSKHYRGRDAYAGKRVVTVGASVSAADITIDLVDTAESPVHAIIIGRRFNTYFGDEAFRHPLIAAHPSIDRITGRTVHLIDGSTIPDVDHIIFGTGYSWSLPFLPQVPVRNNRVPDLYQHVVWRHDPTLLFIGAVGAGLTFKVFEWHAVLAARLLAGRTTLPPVAEQEAWEKDRIAKLGDGPSFLALHPNFGEYFETIRELAGDGAPGVGRKLPPFKQEWLDAFMSGHERRKRMWRRLNAGGAEAVREWRA
ncbi:FAD/NAD(P)-binding domain-containing protein [Cutaneotrichosporon oleaginosum]|uniref:FAD/NAD(P)-binding domain-containing protein n=1 Tax=Cutaneotrichosporon oleaginosum TaxID=879819 RepID=A0A0J0XZF0_9TREE|nr:FAD/NAD(P)-binding domain-containing protein [Cutaneotrichosporon oleaginosum]KLT46410.1 FAD/NAD(P)-binding domain-containing protein [Cutaneotrichosporon oleaginosum]TXT15220.1 hypothetical protein COLE_01413 [Cutaneotrichosporon oleaginosum]